MARRVRRPETIRAPSARARSLFPLRGVPSVMEACLIALTPARCGRGGRVEGAGRQDGLVISKTPLDATGPTALRGRVHMPRAIVGGGRGDLQQRRAHQEGLQPAGMPTHGKRCVRGVGVDRVRGKILDYHRSSPRQAVIDCRGGKVTARRQRPLQCLNPT